MENKKNIYKTFCELEFAKDRPKVIKFLYFIFTMLFIGFFVVFAKAVSANADRYNRFPPSKYKKVIKEGIFFDSIEYHERD